MKYSIKKPANYSVLFTYEKGIKAYRSTPVEKEFWARIQELEQDILDTENLILRGEVNIVPTDSLANRIRDFISELKSERNELKNVTVPNLHKECRKYRVALNRIAHPESWSINEGFEAEIARRALVVGMKVEELPEGAAK